MAEEKQSTRPSVTAPLYAFVRQGAKEIGQVLPAFPDSIRTVEEPGTLGNPTPQMITDEMHPQSSYDRLIDRYSSRGQGDEGRRDQDQGMDR